MIDLIYAATAIISLVVLILIYMHTFEGKLKIHN